MEQKQLSYIKPIDREEVLKLMELYPDPSPEEITHIDHLLHVLRAFAAHRLNIQGDSAEQNQIRESQAL